MSTPKRFLTRMALFLVAVLVAVGLLFPALQVAFMAAPILNGMIIAVLLVGIVYIFRQVLMLGPEAAWIESYRRGGASTTVQRQPRLLGPIANLVTERQGRVSLSAMTLRSLLDGVSSRLDESRDLSRYMVGLLIFLGLLGTFWGLIQTIDSVGQVIANLSFASGDLGTVFQELQAGLESPLSGMGTAFSSSLFGLSGSLILGFLDLQAGQAQNRFYNELEDWLTTLTDIEPEDSAGGSSGLVELRFAIDNLRKAVSEGGGGAGRNAAVAMANLAEGIQGLVQHVRSEQQMMRDWADEQSEQQKRIEHLLKTMSTAFERIKDEAK
jgi:hypothetical protein